MLSAPDRVAAPHGPGQLYRLLKTARDRALRDGSPQIAGLSIALPEVDPLAIFARWAAPDRLSFYLEKPDRSEAVAAFEAVAETTATGSDRFDRVRQFARQTFARVAAIDPDGNVLSEASLSETSIARARPRIFCGFPFLETPRDRAEPFDRAIAFLPRLQVSGYRAGGRDRRTLTLHCPVPADANLDRLCDDLSRELRRLRGQLARLRSPDPESDWPAPLAATEDFDGFRAAVASALDLVRGDRLGKIVLSHALDLTAAAPLDPALLLRNLRRRYPNCYLFALGNGRGQTFLGASPECLLRVDRRARGRELTTEALAGSAPRGRTAREDRCWGDRLLASPKELHEHRLVADFIARCLAELNVASDRAAAPTLRKLANIQHLHTPIWAALPAGTDPLAIAAALHPTPAVAGVPRDGAVAAIARYERFDRALYAAPLGWIDGGGNGEFAVGIRSAVVDGDRARLYAGAGIVAGSDPDREVAEIRLKFQALLSALAQPTQY